MNQAAPTAHRVIVAPPAFDSAVMNALHPLRVTHIEMPAKPELVWWAIKGPRKAA